MFQIIHTYITSWFHYLASGLSVILARLFLTYDIWTLDSSSVAWNDPNEHTHALVLNAVESLFNTQPELRHLTSVWTAVLGLIWRSGFESVPDQCLQLSEAGLRSSAWYTSQSPARFVVPHYCLVQVCLNRSRIRLHLRRSSAFEDTLKRSRKRKLF